MRALIAALVALLTALPLAAHPLKLSETSVSANPRTGQLEVAHSLSLHDMPEMLRSMGAANIDVIGSGEARTFVESYVAQHFHIVADGQPVTLGLIGSEIDGGQLWVYQEAAIPDAAELTIDDRLLHDVFPDQQNRVNVDLGGGIDTLVFRNGSAPQTVKVR
ncbi:MAG: DUF6702 family protein [Pacificimonas sp.]